MIKGDIILFGASNLGEIAFNVLKDECNIIYFSDNDRNKWDKLFCGIKAIAPNELINFNGTKIIIASMYYEEISIQLKNMGLSNIYIFSYVDINDKTYSKRYFIDKMCDLDIYRRLKLEEDFKSKFINNFSLIYGDEEGCKYKNLDKIDSNRRNVLIIAYFFPPIGGSGVQRILKFVKYLKEYGWNPIVITVGEDYCEYEKDFSLLDEIPEDVEIHRIDHKYKNSEQLDKDLAQQILNLLYGVIDNEDIAKQYLSKIKENNCSKRNRLFEPDKYISWVNNVLQSINEIIDFYNIDIIYTTSGPYSDHIAGYYIKRKYNIPLVADFRDEWTNNPHVEEHYRSDETKWELHRHMEQKVVDIADKIITVSPISSENYRSIFNLPQSKVVTITNGYDEEDFGHISNNRCNNKKFTILYYGSLYLNRTLENIILPINELIENNLISESLTEVRIIGRIDVSIKIKLKEIDKYNIIGYTDYLPHLDCLEEASGSNILLLPYGKGEAFKAGYTGKIFEYIRLMVPILSLSPEGSEIEELLNDTQCGENFEYDDFTGIKDYIFRQYNKWVAGEYDFKVNEEKIKEYERRELTKKLSRVFDELHKGGKTNDNNKNSF